jgi:GxxExxY protein
MRINDLTREIIGAAIAVHRELGPGKPEPAYERALALELARRGLANVTQHAVPVVYKGVKLECGYRLDLLVAGVVVIEVKAVEVLHPVHRAQVLTYLKLGGWKIALLLNFNVAVLREGIERLVLGLEEEGDGLAIPPTAMHPKPHWLAPATPQLRRTEDSGNAASEDAAGEVLAAAAEVHRELGPGLLASAYQACLCHELHLRGVTFERKRSLPLSYFGTPLGETDEVELLVGGVVVNPCSLSAIQSVNEAALLSQMRLGGWGLGLLINFNTLRLADGIRRLVLTRHC